MSKTIEQIKAVLLSRIRFFKETITYLNLIQMRQIQQTERLEFLYDVFGYRETNESTTFITIVPNLLAIANRNLELYNNFVEIISDSNANYAYCAFAKTVDMEVKCSSYKRSAKSNHNIPAEYLVMMTFDEYETLTELRHDMKAHLIADQYELMSNIISIEQTIEQQSLGSHMENSYASYFVYRWDEAVRKIQDEYSRNQATIKQLNAESTIPGELSSEEMNAFHKIVTQIKKFNNRETQGVGIDGNKLTIIDDYAYLQQNIKAFVKAYPYFKSMILLRTVREKMQNDELIRNKTIKHYDQTRRVLSNSHSKLQARLTATATQLKAIKSTDLTLEFTQLESTISEFMQDWPGKCPIEEMNNQRIDAKSRDTSQFAKLLMQRLEKVDTQIAELISIKEAEKLAKAEVLRLKHEKEAQQQQEEVSQFLQRRALATAEYFQSVAEKRQAQPASISNAEVQTTQAPAVIVQPSREMRTLIADLSNAHFTTLEKLMNVERDITFLDIKHLVTQLEGVVEEIGNGSSHKRIILKSTFYSELHTHAVLNKERVAKEKKLKGTLVKPHGAGHNNGTLSRFNIVCLQKLFVGAGIDKTLLNELANERQQSEATSSTSVMRTR